VREKPQSAKNALFSLQLQIGERVPQAAPVSLAGAAAYTQC